MDRRIERTRNAVVHATVELVAHRGSGVGMTEIAHAAGVSRKAVYENFGSREEVLFQAAVHLIRAEAVFTPPAREEVRAALQDIAHALGSHMDGHRDFYAAVLSGPSGQRITAMLVDRILDILQHNGAQPDSLYMRCIGYGLMGVFTETLVDEHGGSLTSVVDRLLVELAA